MQRRPDRRLSPILALLAAPLLALACASGGGTGAGAERGPYAELVVENDGPRIVNVFAYRAGTRMRFGTVNGVSEETFEIRESMLESGGQLRVLVEPLGSNTRYFSDPILVSPGDLIEISVSSMIR